jgi:hypothetical protein
MSIASTYSQYLLELYIKEQLENGYIPTAEDIEAQILAYNEMDLSSPQFIASGFHRSAGDESSASLYQSFHDTVMQDLRVLLVNLDNTTAEALRTYERWDNQIQGIEQALYDLENRTGDLVLLARDSEGYINFVAETFKDFLYVDQENTTCLVSPNIRMATLLPNSRIYHALETTLEADDVSFSVTARDVNVSQQRSSAAGIADQINVNNSSHLLNAFKDVNTWWLTSVKTNTPKSVTGTMLIDFGENKTISRISILLHSSVLNTSMYITPLYSVDGYNFTQLPSDSPSKSVVDRGVFNFEAIDARYIKFLMTKNQYDEIDANLYTYEFGAKLIQFFNDSYTLTGNDAPQQLISNALSVIDTDGSIIQFSKLSLDACEAIDDDTVINYFVTVSNTANFGIDSSTPWYAIDPISREIKENPSVLDVGNLDLIELGETYDATISYVTNSGVPTSDFRLVAYDSSSSTFTDTVTSPTDDHYMLINDVDRILNYQLKVPPNPSSVESDDSYFLIDETSLQIFRNVGEQALDSTRSNLVRNIQRGWRFANPFYYCVVEVEEAEGLTINVGPRSMWLNDEEVTGNNVVIPYGISEIRIHKDNWYTPTTGANDLATLVSYDPLYPYNHKMLIEGYSYGTSFPTTEKIYTGVDLFAENEMSKVDVNDFIYNVVATDYTRYATDYDIPSSYTGGTYPSMVFLVKIDEENSDWLNEKFIIRFRAVDQKYKYLRLKAELKTENTSKTPSLMGYKIKLV